MTCIAWAEDVVVTQCSVKDQSHARGEAVPAGMLAKGDSEES